MAQTATSIELKYLVRRYRAVAIVFEVVRILASVYVN